MSCTNVDRIGNKIIRKLHSPDRTKVFGYLLLELDGDNILDKQEFTALSAARAAAGRPQLQSQKGRKS